VCEFEQHVQRFSAHDCRTNAERFSIATFREHFMAFVEQALPGATGHGDGLPHPAGASDQQGIGGAPVPVKAPALDRNGGLGAPEVSLGGQGLAAAGGMALASTRRS
jgi:hypothetical protein